MAQGNMSAVVRVAGFEHDAGSSGSWLSVRRFSWRCCKYYASFTPLVIIQLLSKASTQPAWLLNEKIPNASPRDVLVWRVVLWCRAQFPPLCLTIFGSKDQSSRTCWPVFCRIHVTHIFLFFYFFLQVDDASVLQCLFLLKQDRLGRADCSEETVVIHTDWTGQY